MKQHVLTLFLWLLRAYIYPNQLFPNASVSLKATLIRNYLSGVPGVAHFQDEHVQFGGAGITVVDLD